jgi:hypothetical protein
MILLHQNEKARLKFLRNGKANIKVVVGGFGEEGGCVKKKIKCLNQLILPNALPIH